MQFGQCSSISAQSPWSVVFRNMCLAWEERGKVILFYFLGLTNSSQFSSILSLYAKCLCVLRLPIVILDCWPQLTLQNHCLRILCKVQQQPFFIEGNKGSEKVHQESWHEMRLLYLHLLEAKCERLRYIFRKTFLVIHPHIVILMYDKKASKAQVKHRSE